MRRLYENMGIPLRSPLPPERHWNYEMPVFGVNGTFQNSVGENDYLFEVNLTDENFDFSRAQPDGGDVEFQDSLGRNLRSFVHRWSQENKTGQCIVASYGPGDLEDQEFTMFYGNSHKDYDYLLDGSITIRRLENPPLPPPTTPLYWNVSGSGGFPFSAATFMPMGYYTVGVQGVYKWAGIYLDYDTELCDAPYYDTNVASCMHGGGGHVGLAINYGINYSNGPCGWITKTIPNICEGNRSLPGQFGFGHFYVPYPAPLKIVFWTSDVTSYNGKAVLHIYRDTKIDGFPRYNINAGF